MARMTAVVATTPKIRGQAGGKPHAPRHKRGVRSYEDDLHNPQKPKRRSSGVPSTLGRHPRWSSGGFSAQDARFKRQAKSRRLTALKRV